MLLATWDDPTNLFQGAGGAVLVLAAGWFGNIVWRRWRMRADEIDTAQAKDKSDRELLETLYGAMVTAPPTPLNPRPNPGLIEQVENIRNEQANVALELAEHRAEVSAKLLEDQHAVKALLEQHQASDTQHFEAIQAALERLKPS